MGRRCSITLVQLTCLRDSPLGLQCLVKLLFRRSLLLVVRTRTQGASSPQSSCLHHGGMRALLPVVELQQKQTCACCSASGSGMGEGRSCTLPCSPHLWAGDSPPDRRKGLRSGGASAREEVGKMRLAKEQKSPPFPLLCSCCRQGCAA